MLYEDCLYRPKKRGRPVLSYLVTIVLSGFIVAFMSGYAEAESDCSSLSGTAQKIECLDRGIEASKRRVQELQSQSFIAGGTMVWLQSKKASQPEATEKALQNCNAPGQDISATLNCMYKI